MESEGSPVLVGVHRARPERVAIRASADEEEDDQEQRLEVEERGLEGTVSCLL